MAQRNVLIVDDSEVVLEMARDALQSAGYIVFTATNGIEANNVIFSRNKPDIIILDVMMPMLDGHKKAKLLKEWEFSKGIPILLFSSKPVDELKKLVEESGADGFIHKPFTSTEIISVVTKMLG